MQDNWQDFDRQVRSMLQDAEAKAPRRVWRAVSERLEPATPAVAWWKWAVPAFAAAALAVGLFFNWGGPGAVPGGEILPQEGPATAELIPDTAAEVLEIAADDVPAASGPVVSPVTRSRRSASKPLLADASGTIQPSETPAQHGNAPEDAVQADTHSDATPSATDTYSECDAARWASIESESHKAQRIRLSGLYAQGGIGGNDSNIRYGGSPISRMAPGAGSADAGISEAGASTYGVPFTIGLGTRFHIGDKFSLGTGLEYSLLTRTFDGTYSESYTGSIFHAVQYVGVPVNAYYHLLSTRDGLLNLYAWGGGAAEVCVSNSYRLLSGPGTTINDKAGALQFSVGLGIGVEIPITGSLSLYLDPAVRYYFHGNQPKSLRTDKPFMVNFDAGLRFNL